MAVRYVKITVYNCPACGRRLATNPWRALGNPLTTCPYCRAPVARSWYSEWAHLSSSERADFALRMTVIPMALAMLSAAGVIWAGLPTALAVEACVAALGLAIALLILGAQVRASLRRTADPEHLQRLAAVKLDQAGPVVLWQSLAVCVFGLLVASACLYLHATQRQGDLGHGLQSLLKLGVCGGVAVLAWGLIGLGPIAFAERRFVGLGFVTMWTIAAAVAFYLVEVAPLGSTLSQEQLVALLDQPDTDPAVQAAVARLGKLSGEGMKATTWKHHGVAIWKEDGRVSKIEFGLPYDNTPYAGTLPFGLHAGDTPDQVRSALGDPDVVRSRSGNRIRAGAQSPDRQFEYQYPLRGIRVDFRDGRLESVSVSALFVRPPTPVSAGELALLPGKSRNSPEVQKVRAAQTFAGSKLEERKQADHTSLAWGTRIELRLDPAGTVTAVVLGSDYVGDLPHGLHFDDTRNDVRRKLGPAPPPAKEVEDYPDKGVRVEYFYGGVDGVYRFWITQPGTKLPPRGY